MAYKATNYGFNAAMYGELSPSMVNLLNQVEMSEDEGGFVPSNIHEEKLCKVALLKGFIVVI